MKRKQFGLVANLSFSAAFALCIFLPVSGSTEESVSHRLGVGRSVAALETFRDCDRCPEMIVMPHGSFMMGAVPGESKTRSISMAL